LLQSISDSLSTTEKKDLYEDLKGQLDKDLEEQIEDIKKKNQLILEQNKDALWPSE
jgi:hypothetical protein